MTKKVRFRSVLIISAIVLISQLALIISPQALAQLAPIQNNVSVSAVVPPTASHFQFDFNYVDDSLVHQDQAIPYEIIYGASSSAGLATTNTIVVHYSRDKASDKSYLVEYVLGSATKGYGGVDPIIDVQERTITWTIPTLPEGTMDQKLNFKLRSNNKAHGLKRQVFRSTAAMSNDYVTLPDYGVQQEYLFDPSLMGPTTSPTQNNVPTPSPVADSLKFLDISFSNLSASTAAIGILSNQPAIASIRYGTSPFALTQRSEETGLATFNTIELKGLKTATTYYFQVVLTDATGEILRSDIITFETAQSSQPMLQGKDAYAISSGDTILLSDILDPNAESSGFVLMPIGHAYKLTYTFGSEPSVASLETIIRNDRGILQRVQMTALDKQTYIAQLRTDVLGTYNIEVIQSDEKGNIVSRKISILEVVSPISVLESETKTPLSDARIFITRLDPGTKKYEPVENASFKNPSFTNLQGELNVLLSKGNYRIEVSAFGFKERSIDFTIGSEKDGGYPTIVLERDVFNIASLSGYIKTMLVDSSESIRASLVSFSNSIRAFAAMGAVSLFSFISVGFSLFTIRTDIFWKDLVPFFLFHVAVLRRKHKEGYLFGSIVDMNGNPLSRVRLEYMHIKTSVILAHGVSNKTGSFRTQNTFDVPYVKLVATKDGFPPVSMIVPTDMDNMIKIQLKSESKNTMKDLPLIHGITHMAGGFFEVILITTLLLELLFIESFGVARTMPFILLTFFNLALWIFYEKERGHAKVN